MPDSRTHHTDPQIDSVERALSALRHVEVPTGLEERVLRGVQHRRTEAPAASRWRALRLAWVLPAFAALTALLLLTVSLDRKHPAAPPVAALNPPQASALRPPVAPNPLPAQHAIQHTYIPSRIPTTTLAARKLRAGSRSETHSAAVHTSPQPEEPDHPAPELPLTREERLLVRIAYGPQPQQQVALLHRNGMRLRPPAEDDFDFNAFFEPHTTPLTEGDPQ